VFFWPPAAISYDRATARNGRDAIESLAVGQRKVRQEPRWVFRLGGGAIF
jgi:hypothetical protein